MAKKSSAKKTEKENKKIEESSNENQSSGVDNPILYNNPVVINKDDHKNSGISKKFSLAFAKGTNSLPANHKEFVELAKTYPIAFTGKDKLFPIVVLGLKGENAFVDSEGQWKKGCYIPAYVRRYPFILADLFEKLYLCIDDGFEGYEHNNPDMRFFEEDGTETEFTKNAMNFCVSYNNAYKETEEFSETIKNLDILEDYTAEITHPKEGKLRFAGFKVINREKLEALSRKTITELQDKGYLEYIYYLLQSQTNWGNLV